jgi:hypothetical protein
MSGRGQDLRNIGPEVPSNILELRAAEQRQRLHNVVADLRHTVAERTDVSKLARNHLWPATGIASLAGLIMGYGTAKIFTR